MKEKINSDTISWINADAVWLYPILKDYLNSETDLGMDYLTLPSLRFDEKYFVGYIFDNQDPKLPIKVVSYIQYKMLPNRLILNYMEVARQYRGNGLSKTAIDEFVNRTVPNRDIPVYVTSFSNDGKQANLLEKLQATLTGEIEEVSKRDIG